MATDNKKRGHSLLILYCLFCASSICRYVYMALSSNLILRTSWPQKPLFSLRREQSPKKSCRDAIVIWDNIILDGHNRYDICKCEDIPFKTICKSFEDRESAMDWIDANQLARRNLTPEQVSLIRGRRYNRIKKTPSEAGAIKSYDQNDHSLTSKKSPRNMESLLQPSDVMANLPLPLKH